VVRDDIFTSIHVDDYSLEVRDTKLGNEELTNDIPNVSEEAKDLDENGMIRIGAEVKPGDILMELLQRGIRSTQKRNCFVQSSVIKQVM
jgi:DNA-directed RNA polymerase subunit beta